MFEKNHLIKVDLFSMFTPTVSTLRSKLLVLSGGETVLVNNDEESFNLVRYSKNGKTEYSVDAGYGQLVNITYYNDSFWLEFHDPIAPYMEEYTIIRAGKNGPEHILSFPRESWQHDMGYHSLFIKDGGLYLHYLRHNRLHHYLINTENNSVDEIDVLEGGKWFLCGDHPVCIIRDVLELYDSSLNIVNTIEYDNEVDEIHFALSRSPYLVAIALSDVAQEQTALIIHQDDAETTHMSYLENTIADMGVSGGRIWLNPYCFLDQQDLGGCMIYDRFAWPLYVHMRTKNPNAAGIGTFPPPFHRSERITGMANGMTIVAEHNRVLVFDYACRPVQEIPIANPSCFGLNDTGDTLAVLNIDTSDFENTDTSVKREASIDIYTFNSESDDSKVIEMAKFTR